MRKDDEVFGVFRMQHSNEEVAIAQMPIEVKVSEDTTLKGTAKASITWTPIVGLEIKASFPTIRQGFPAWRSSYTLTLPGWSTIPDKMVALGDSVNPKERITNVVFRLNGERKLSLFKENNIAFSKVLFHVLNFSKFMTDSESVKVGNEIQCQYFPIGIINIRADEWVISISDVASQCPWELHKTGGYAITHIGSIRSANGNRFDLKSVKNLLECLRYFLSFSAGSWIEAFLPVGYNKHGQSLWEEWGVHRIQPVESRHRSCLFLSPETALPQAFQGFWNLWNDSAWETSLKDVIAWYIMSNTMVNPNSEDAVEGAVIFSQAALELLSWVYIVNHPQLTEKTKQHFKEKNTARKIRKFFRTLGLPNNVPPQIKDISKRRGGADSAKLIADLRNDIVHPDRQLCWPPSDIMDIWNLAQWYVEMALLKLIGYRGDYLNRIASGIDHIV